MRLDVYTKTKLEKQATRFFRRLQHTNPFPAIVNDIVPGETDPIYNTYMSCLPPHIRKAVLQIMTDSRYITLLDRNNYAYLTVEVADALTDKGYISVPIEFFFGELKRCSVRKIQLDPEHPALGKIVSWVHRCRQVNRETNKCIKYVRSVVEWANTVGQLRSMFPDYVHLLPEHQQRHIAAMKRRASLPKDVDRDYLRANQRFVAEKAATCLLLPEKHPKIWIE